MVTIQTDHPIAVDSIDHLFPRGTKQDSSVSAAFNRKLFARAQAARVLDLGCAGGGMVESILADGGFAVGVEGSDYSLNANRAAWATIPENLFTADATKPFWLLNPDGTPLSFTYVTAWEFFEHIETDHLPGVFDNIRRHLTPTGLLIVSIATTEDPDHSHPWHRTVQPAEWWLDVLATEGFNRDDDLTAYFAPDWVRGPLTGSVTSLCAVFRRAIR